MSDNTHRAAGHWLSNHGPNDGHEFKITDEYRTQLAARLRSFGATARQPSRYRRPAKTKRRQARSLVEPDGIEPTTSCLQSRRSPN